MIRAPRHNPIIAMQIGSYQLDNNLILAPMAGVSDRPFRELCLRNGAGLAVSEMIAANPALRQHKRTMLKADHNGETGIRSIQILGAQPGQMADAAQYNARGGAQIIDINMGCPAKKVCSQAAGSALLKNEGLVEQILDAVVAAVDIPVTLKIRTGWDLQNRNAVTIAKIAEQAGIAALTVHGRTRACRFDGQAEYETIRQVKQAVSIPVIANGNIDSPEKAKQVLDYTGADALMIGRAAQGTPWLFNAINHFLKTGKQPEKPDARGIHETMVGHLEALYRFYGHDSGVKIARKHIAWYFKHFEISQHSKNAINRARTPREQVALIHSVFRLLTNAGAA